MTDRLLDSLDEPEKPCLDERYSSYKYNGKTYKEIAESIGKSPLTVKSYVYQPDRKVPDSIILDWCFATGDMPWDVANHLYPLEKHPVIDSYIKAYQKKNADT